jgi:3-dehydroquinate synthase class II
MGQDQEKRHDGRGAQGATLTKGDEIIVERKQTRSRHHGYNFNEHLVPSSRFRVIYVT